MTNIKMNFLVFKITFFACKYHRLAKAMRETRLITNLSHISNLMGHRKITKIVLDKRTSYYIVAQYYTSQIQTRFKSDLSQN